MHVTINPRHSERVASWKAGSALQQKLALQTCAAAVGQEHFQGDQQEAYMAVLIILIRLSSSCVAHDSSMPMIACLMSLDQ